MEALDAVDGQAIKAFAKNRVKPGSEIRTDGWTHIVISNAKAFAQGTFHGLDAKRPQRCLDEFCCRLNRRFFDHALFSHLVGACSLAPPKRAGISRGEGAAATNFPKRLI
jgi:hypothetical protein